MAKLRDIFKNIKKYLLIRDIKTGELDTISINGSNVLSFDDLSNLLEEFKTSKELKQYLLNNGIIKTNNVDLFISDYDSQYYKNKKFKLKPLNGKIYKDDYIFNIDHPDCLAQPVNDH